MARPKFPMVEGEHLGRNPNKPVIEVVADGPSSYLWVGNDARRDMMCFAMLQGRDTLLALADAIYETLKRSRPTAHGGSK